MGGPVDASQIKQALKARKDAILENIETMTLKSCRRQLEEDLGLEKDALKEQKELIGQLIDQLIAKHKAKEAKRAEKEPGGKKRRSSAGGSSAGKAAAKPRKQAKAAAAPAAKAAGPKQYSREVERLRGICRAATVTIPPSLYVKNKGDDALEAALGELLAKHGLSGGSGPNEVARAKAALQIQRDLDGIDTSNILEGGRGRRGAAARPAVNYRQMAADSEEEEEEEEGGESDSEGSQPPSGGKSDAGASAEAEADDGASEPSDAFQDAEGSDGEEEQQQRSPAKAKAKAKSPQRSPSENRVAPGSAGKVGSKGSAPLLGSSGKNVPPSKAQAKPASKVVAGLESDDDDGGEPAQPAAKKARAVLANWSDDDE